MPRRVPPRPRFPEELKAQLFVRDKRATGLTPAGRQLLADIGPLLASADALRRRVTRAARGPGSAVSRPAQADSRQLQQAG
jgi:DNA-binding transcriptional LysR family regulator